MAERAEQIIAAYNKSKSARSNVDNSYRDIERLVLPSFLGSNTDQRKSEGNDERPVSSVATSAAILLGANIYSYTFSSSDRNFALRSSKVEDQEAMKTWLQDASDVATRYIQTSNFSQIYAEYCQVWPNFGTAIASVEYDNDKDELIFAHHPVSANNYIVEGDNGRVDGIFRLIKYSAREALEKFGEENLNDKAKAALTDVSKINDKFDYICAVTWNPDYKPESLNIKHAKYRVEYVCKKDKKVVKQSGYRSFPYAVSRFIKPHDGSPYGIGCGHIAMPAIKESNIVAQDFIDAIEMAGSPPIAVSDMNVVDQLDQHGYGPNTVIPISQDSNITPIQIHGDPAAINERRVQLEEEINKQFFSNVFLAVMHSERSHKTAREIDEMSSEKFSSIAPMITRLRNEFWGPMIERVVELLMDAGKIERPSPEIAGKEFDINYVSQIDTRLEILDGQKAMLALQGASQILAAGMENPELNKIVKIEDMAKGHLTKHNVDYDYIVSDVEREEMRQAEQAQMQQAQMQEQQAQMSNNIAPVDMSKKPEDGSPIDQMQQAGVL